MKILLDECIPFALYHHFRTLHHEVEHVSKTKWSGFNNSKLYDAAKGQYQIFITTDRHFTHPEKFSPTMEMGVIYLRVAPTVGPLLVEAMNNLMKSVDLSSLIGKLTIVRRNDYELR